MDKHFLKTMPPSKLASTTSCITYWFMAGRQSHFCHLSTIEGWYFIAGWYNVRNMMFAKISSSKAYRLLFSQMVSLTKE
jgi:hypothetical protein